MTEDDSGKARRIYLAALRAAKRDTVDLASIAMKLQRASELGLPEADYALATWYLFGNHFEKNVRKGNSLLRKAARAGNADACYDLAVSYDNGFGLPRNPQRAFELYMEAAMRGDIEAHRQVARCFWDGSGVRKSRVLADLWGTVHEKLLKSRKERARPTKTGPKPHG